MKLDHRRVGLAIAGLMVLVSCSSQPSFDAREPATWGEVEVHVTSVGRPIAGAEVQAWRDRTNDLISMHEEPLGTLTTNAHGFARAVVRSDAVRLVVQRRGFVTQVVETVHLDGKRVAVALDLEAEALISGRLIDAKGHAVTSVQVEAAHEWPLATATTDAEGCFVLEGLSKGHYRLSVPHVPGLYDRPASIEVDAPTEDVILSLSPDGGALEVALVSPPGAEPVSTLTFPQLERRDATGAWTVVNERKTDPSARPRVERMIQLPPGVYRVMVRVPATGARVSAPVEVQAGATAHIRVELEPGRTVFGRILDSSGNPCKACLGLYERADDAHMIATRPDGGYSAANCPDEEFLVTVSRDAVASDRVVVHIPAGRRTTSFDITLP